MCSSVGLSFAFFVFLLRLGVSIATIMFVFRCICLNFFYTCCKKSSGAAGIVNTLTWLMLLIWLTCSVLQINRPFNDGEPDSSEKYGAVALQELFPRKRQVFFFCFVFHFG